MQCPACSVDLVMSERQGIEIDYCPKCRGVWLDRGELDKIIEKAALSQPTASQGQQAYQGGYHGKPSDYEYKKHKRKSFLHELFD
jgi:uncharacterized protein